MKHVIAALSALAFAAATLTVSASPAQADTPGCATKAEFRAIKKGMGMRKVHGILDTKGERLSRVVSSWGATSEMRSYKTCSPYSSVVALYGNGRLENKSAVWVS